VFDKAIDDAASLKTYARLCRKMMDQVSSTIQDEDITSSTDVPAAGGSLFRKYLIIQFQDTLKRRHASYEAAVAAVKLANDNGLNTLAAAKLQDVIEHASQFGRGPVKFVIELCALQMFGGMEETIISVVFVFVLTYASSWYSHLLLTGAYWVVGISQ
jgi:translation initiation factor 4G